MIRRLLDAGGERTRVAAVYDPDAVSRSAAESAFGSDTVFCGSEEELVSHPEVSWVFIGSPNAHHARQAILALRSGRDVFCEKPLATSLEDCLAVRRAVRETGRKFALGLVLRYSPHYQKVRELVQSGAIGEIISFEFNETLSFNHGGYIFGNWRRYRAEAGTHLLEKCCHDLDLVNWIVGSRPRFTASFGGRNFFLPENERHMARIGPNADGRPAYQVWEDPHGVNPFTAEGDIFDNQVAIIEYENLVRATFHTNCHAGIPERRLYLCGTEGGLRADACTGAIALQKIGHNSRLEQIQIEVADGHGGGDPVMAGGMLRTMLEDEPPLANVDDGVRAGFSAFLIDEAADQRRVVDAREYAFAEELWP